VLQLVLVFVQLKKGAAALAEVEAEALAEVEAEVVDQLLSSLIPKTNHAQL
jgi:hypothetical protein